MSKEISQSLSIIVKVSSLFALLIYGRYIVASGFIFMLASFMLKDSWYFNMEKNSKRIILLNRILYTIPIFSWISLVIVFEWISFPLISDFVMGMIFVLIIDFVSKLITGSYMMVSIKESHLIDTVELFLAPIYQTYMSLVYKLSKL